MHTQVFPGVHAFFPTCHEGPAERHHFDVVCYGINVSLPGVPGWDLMRGSPKALATLTRMFPRDAAICTADGMPLPIVLSHKLARRLSESRNSGELPWLRPDGKSQVSVEYVNGVPTRVDAVVVSTQHDDNISTEELRKEVKAKIIDPVIPAGMVDSATKFHINPTGRFVIGGPHGDTGLTGRKIIVDTYGGMGRHGGGAFSGKDPTKVDRSACYMARYVAKNLVAAGLATRAEVQLAYAIGVAEPVSVNVNTFGTGVLDEEKLVGLIRAHFPLTPKGMIEHLDLRRPIYRATAAFGHFGRNEFPWESTAKAAALRADAGIAN